jgi:TonB-linked SusC/RagA family outer membrane protein
MSTRRVFRSLALASLLVPVSAVFAAAQAQQGTVTGRVTDAASSQPLSAVMVSVSGTNIGAQTNAEGQFILRGVAPGTVSLRALRIGYAEARQTVTLAAGGTATVNLTMSATPVTLNPVVTTATGLQDRNEVGNAIAQVDASSINETRAVTNVGDLLTARAAGVMVIPGVQTGAGTRIRIRGLSSLSLANNPMFIIDGVRVETTTGSSSVSVGGTTASRLGDLNPEDIETMEVVRGPSAATLYGTDAANGVIVITTKKGVAGRPVWTYYTEQTAIRDESNHPTAYTGWRTGTTSGTTSTPANRVQCVLTQVASGACAQDSVTAYNLFDDPEASPFGTGYRQQHGLQLRGGSEAIRYFISGEWEDEDGVTKVPEFDQRWLSARGLSMRPEEQSPNRLTRVSTRANLNVTLPRNGDIGVSVGYVTQDLRLPQSDDSGTDGILGNAYAGPGFKYNLTATGDTLYGWRQFTPRDTYQQTTTQGIERFIGGLTPSWRPADWLALNSTLGVDFIMRHETQLCRFGECPPNGENRLGFKTDNRTNFYTYTAKASATGTHRFSDDLESKTTLGGEFYRNIFSRNGAFARDLPPGATTVTAGAREFADETTTESRTFGGFLEQNLAYRDRLYFTAGLRSDRNSAFGADFATVLYPKVALSWVASRESFFPQTGWMDELRFRTAYGASGVQPGTTDAVLYFSSTTASLESGDFPGVVFTALGNRNLKPERSTEWELGADGTFWNGRLTAELTYYNKQSSDALVSRVLAPSLGTGLTSRFENVGKIQNSGWEGLLNARLITRNSFGWDVLLNASANNNKAVDLGELPSLNLSSTQRHVEGYPLFGWWVVPLTGYADANGDGIITVSEITTNDDGDANTDDRIYVGQPLPTLEAALTNGVDLLQGRLRIAAMVDYKGGHKVYNNTERIRCASRLNCNGLVNPEASHFEQARTVLVREHPTRSVGGFIEDGDFLRFRELSVVYTVPESLAGRLFRGRSLVATAAARNLGVLWTKYSGVDPEAFGTTGDAPSSFQAFAPPTYYTLRLTFGL